MHFLPEKDLLRVLKVGINLSQNNGPDVASKNVGSK